MADYRLPTNTKAALDQGTGTAELRRREVLHRQGSEQVADVCSDLRHGTS
jgi:hypothetical protein